MNDHWLFRALATGDQERVELTIEADSSLLTIKGGHEMMGLLYHAIQQEQREIADFLRSKGVCLSVFEASILSDHEALVNIIDDTPDMINAWREHYYATPLQCAIRNLETVRILLENGADPLMINSDKQQHQAIHMAVFNKDFELVKLLHKHGADLKASSTDGTPLHCIASDKHNESPEIIDYLLEHGADINAPVRKGSDLWTPLHQACESRNTWTVQYLLDKGADYTLSKDGLSPLFLAESCNLEEVVKVLKDNGA